MLGMRACLGYGPRPCQAALPLTPLLLMRLHLTAWWKPCCGLLQPVHQCPDPVSMQALLVALLSSLQSARMRHPTHLLHQLCLCLVACWGSEPARRVSSIGLAGLRACSFWRGAWMGQGRACGWAIPCAGARGACQREKALLAYWQQWKADYLAAQGASVLLHAWVLTGLPACCSSAAAAQ